VAVAARACRLEHEAARLRQKRAATVLRLHPNMGDDQLDVPAQPRSGSEALDAGVTRGGALILVQS
jgi:hypothetical protein